MDVSPEGTRLVPSDWRVSDMFSQSKDIFQKVSLQGGWEVDPEAAWETL